MQGDAKARAGPIGIFLSSLNNNKKNKKGVPPGSGPDNGNVFADLGLPDAADLMAKANLALHIRHVIEARKLTQVQAAALLGLDQPKVSQIVNGRLDGFSTDRLLRFLTDLGCDVKISVSAPHPESRGHVAVA